MQVFTVVIGTVIALASSALADSDWRETRLAGYQTLLKYPAPWGLRNKTIEAKLSSADHLGEIEAWLDQRSRAAELLGRADYLLFAHRLLNCTAAKSEVEQSYAAVKNFDPRHFKFTSLANSLDILQAELEKAAGGTIDPVTGTDIFTWIKAWDLGYEEPTPYRAAYVDGVVIRLIKPGDTVDFRSSWTTNTYTTSEMTITYSILGPISVIDLKTNALAAEISGLTKLREMPAEGWFALASKGNIYLFVSNRKIDKVDCSGTDLRIGFHAPAAVAYARLPLSVEKDLPTLAKFYQALLQHQPVQCVQIQKGNHVEQIFQYIDRPCEFPIKPLLAAPLPHLVFLSLKPSSKLKVNIGMPIRRAPDGWSFVSDTDRIAYDMPERPYAHSGGINVWLDQATGSTYRELRDLGCKTVRLVCRSSPGWEGMTMEKKKELVCRNLTWIRQAGNIKVGIDLHNEWLPAALKDARGFQDPALLREFTERWKAILSWCEPYRDVIGWYDLMNEPLIFCEREPVKPYAIFMQKAIHQLRPYAGTTPFLVEAVNMANAGGLAFWEDLGQSNIIAGYHDYWPHMFTHQRCVEPGNPSMPAVFYPSFMPGISWTSPSWRNDSSDWHYWDCWKCNSFSLPVYSLLIEKGVRLDCGEYGVVGYAGQTSPISSTIWLRHAVERFKRLGINHNAWGFHGGFTWNIPQAKEELHKFWTRNK
ncbi:MAG: cellulase family glycosylhydrolase [Pirellulales bacterium]|nr:cellulase family glycosylhydrolase [Pirellulales bacterium]